MMNPHITTLIFDVGGVLVSDYSTTWEDVLDRTQLDEHTFHDVWMDIVKRFGSGKMTEQEVWDELAEHGAPKVSVSENIMGRPFNEKVVIYQSILDKVRELNENGYQIAILSNTIQPHAIILRELGVYEPFGNNVFLSNEIGIRKPSVEAYQYVIAQLNIINPSSVIFFDDRIENLTPAAELGMQTYHVSGEQPLIHELVKLLSKT